MFSSRFLQRDWPKQWFRLLTQWLCVPTQWLCVLYYRGAPYKHGALENCFPVGFYRGFLHGQNHGCTLTFFHFFGNFHAHFFFARPLFLFFARVTDSICTGTFLRICRIKLGFTAYLRGKWPKILHVHFLICTGVNYPKFARAKLVFHGHYFAIFRAFTRALFFCTGKNWKFCTGQPWFCTPKKNTDFDKT